MGLVILILGVVVLFLPQSIVGTSFPQTGVALACAIVSLIVSVIESKKGKKTGQMSLLGSIIFLIILVVIIIIAFIMQQNNNEKVKEKINKVVALDTAYGIEKAAKLYYKNEISSGSSQFKLTVFWCNGDECSKDGKRLDLSGITVPTSGTITIYQNGNVKGENLSIGNFTCHFSESENPTCE